jgi:ADP-heptose:LPS heptosyltransferase
MAAGSITAAAPDRRPVALVLSTGEAMGDALTRIAGYRALRIAFPGHRVVHVCRWSSSLLGPLASLAAELVDEIIDGQSLTRGPRPVRDIIRGIGNVEIVIDLRSNMGAAWSFVATTGTRVRYVANVALYGLRRGFRASFEARPETNSRRFHRAVELAAGRLLPFDPFVPVGDAAALAADRVVPPGARFVMLAPGTSQSPKAWPAANWVALARHLATRGVQPLFVVGPQELAERNWIERDLPGTAVVDIRSVRGPADLPWLFHALAARAVGSVTVEGGIGHLVATTGQPLVTISGATDIRRWRPVTLYHWSASAREFGSRRTAVVPLDAVVTRAEEMITFADRTLAAPSIPSSALVKRIAG